MIKDANILPRTNFTERIIWNRRNIWKFLFDKGNVRGKSIILIINDIDDEFKICDRIRDHIFNNNGMSFMAERAHDSGNKNFVFSAEQIGISFIASMKRPFGVMAVSTFNFIEINRINNFIVWILTNMLDFFFEMDYYHSVNGQDSKSTLVGGVTIFFSFYRFHQKMIELLYIKGSQRKRNRNI